MIKYNIFWFKSTHVLLYFAPTVITRFHAIELSTGPACRVLVPFPNAIHYLFCDSSNAMYKTFVDAVLFSKAVIVIFCLLLFVVIKIFD